MMTNSEAIVLNTLKYGETKIFVNAYTREYGMLTLSTSSSKRKRSNFSNCFQPLSIIEVEFEMKPHADIHPVKSARIGYPATDMAFNPYKMSISMFLAEFLRHALANEQKDYTLFDYIVQSIEWLDAAKEGFSNFHILFMTKLSKFIGIYPNIDSYASGYWFDLADGAFSPIAPTHRKALQPADAAIVPLLARLSFSSMHLLKLSRANRNRCAETIMEYYRLHLPCFPELKSFAVLKELFA